VALPIIVARGTVAEVAADCARHALYLMDGYKEDPEGYPIPSVTGAVRKTNPDKDPFLKDRLEDWAKEENSSLLHS
jgi:hypothetical protein